MKRGEIWSVSLDPTSGGEQRGHRPVLIVSPDALNARTTPIICPIATAAVGQRAAGFAISLAAAGTTTTGVILCTQVRTLDIKSRRGRQIEAVPAFIMDEVLACLQDIFEA
jgi:mRNA-degrading endonuclease toxin of MazEF toxin-antitoxin module